MARRAAPDLNIAADCGRDSASAKSSSKRAEVGERKKEGVKERERERERERESECVCVLQEG